MFARSKFIHKALASRLWPGGPEAVSSVEAEVIVNRVNKFDYFLMASSEVRDGGSRSLFRPIGRLRTSLLVKVSKQPILAF